MQRERCEMNRDFRQHKKYQKGTFKSKWEIEQELRENGVDRIYYVLSFGGGTQSAHLLEKHFKGLIHYDYIIFADTGAEPQFIHDQVQWWRNRQKEYGNKTPFIITHHNSMTKGLEEMLMRYIHTDYQRFQMPVHCSRIDPETGQESKAGIMPRQCTVDFKIVPVKQTARRLVMKKLGLKPQQRMPANIAFIIDIGFSYDEINRISTYQSPQFKYMYLSYPLVEEGLTTDDSIQFLMENRMPSKRSRCYLCPFNCDKQGMDWKEIIEEEPFSFLKACWFDEQLRQVQRTGRKAMKSIPYLHHARIPLKDAYPSAYSFLSEKYKADFESWLSSWRRFISEKYAV
ncbi:hypothetical protein H1164_15070 [Thermoactinomyces daqus]|uniref:Phosphoadenosine phosphosulphate reductase domain-containing protein n=2 Tax=Thermoactinomyces daqus TaxID=1329516 RepID=A0A7W2AJT1_9BACL|nr:hypothetical protein [Thermoactinomyces daqus]